MLELRVQDKELHLPGGIVKLKYSEQGVLAIGYLHRGDDSVREELRLFNDGFFIGTLVKKGFARHTLAHRPFSH